MDATAFDYIRNVHSLSESLLLSHGRLLTRKNVGRKRELIRAIKLDLDKLTHALVEVKENRAPALLERFFAGSAVDCSEITARLSDHSIYHLGFEIYEPMDLVLYGINRWIEHSRRDLGVEMRIKELLRFPASPAFQNRVGAPTEIMRIWIETGDHTLMLELFDIHRPADSVLAAAPPATHRNFHGLFRSADRETEHRERLLRLFAHDEIWHYALHVRSPHDVSYIHELLRDRFAVPSPFTLPYGAPVHNPHDDSFHTKIVRRAQPPTERLEIEFVTQYSAGDRSVTASI